MKTNKVELIETSYLNRASRSVNVMIVSDRWGNRVVLYVYNYEGVHYRIFSTLQELLNCLEGLPISVLAEFETEDEVDIFLGTYIFDEI